MPRAAAPPSTDPVAPADAWFAARGWEPFAFQRDVWRAYLDGEGGLIHAATGTGKTYAAWLGPVLEWIAEHPDDPTAGKAPPLRILWITPLRALAADTEEALRAPLTDLRLPWTLESRTGDTSSAVRSRQRTRLPTALVTTPESLALLLSRDDARQLFSDLRAVVVDEWHELMGTKRGVQVELALARLRGWRPALRTWGLSATIGNLHDAQDALLGTAPGRAQGRIIRAHIPKEVVVDALIPPTIERFPWAGHLGTQMLPQVVAAIKEGETAIVFTNTRSQTEIWYQALLDARPDWAGQIALHHGSLDRARREWVENGLRSGKLRCVVATSSLDLGVDFSPVDRVLQIGSPKGVARLLQRAGRSGHRPGAVSRVTCVPTNALELIEVAAARDGMHAGAVESRLPVDRPLDLLAQHVVTVALGGGFRSDALKAEVRTTRAYAGLMDDEWQWVLDFVTRGGDALSAYPEFQRVVISEDGTYNVGDKQIARRHRMSIGTIVSDASVTVKYLGGGSLGSVEEGFIARLKPGDKFVFAGKPLEFVRVRDMVAWVRRATSIKGMIPRWMGARMPLSTELAASLRGRLEEASRGVYRDPEMQAIRPILEIQARWSRIPAADELLLERVKTREGHHLFFFPFEGRLVHEGLAALFAYRISRLLPISFTFSMNDYGLELLSPDPAPLDEALAAGLLSPRNLLEDVPASLNATEMARRQFREIARVAGLVFQGFPHAGKTARQLQASSGLFFDVFTRYDPGNLLVSQAHREVLERQLESSRLGRTLERLAAGRVAVTTPRRTPPLAFPLLVDRTREAVTSESLADRVRRMQVALEKAADTGK
ncbi:ligase-associated DNA damage response DEXH box helicase [Longimicrobium sp.]|uniref:ligase-associated DNA damage response DEXH box helicase n=1 Tax=Longimicrobium sp. TaxID=2029185 RepID=UPI002E360FB3|nr:ligase-associated DNA damage response DEXH box helicase [Longimicrobium sp.]HEX6042186.1 ligase-associated DNA damage response DEXH box helicase [Longimicrobium sp.]